MIGAIIGDIAGSRYEFDRTNDYNFEMFSDENGFTDDTICTVAVADAIMKERDYGRIIHEWCRRYPYPMGSYGGRFSQWVRSDDLQPYGSYGNGAAMRVSPVAWFYEDRDDVLEQAKQTATCTHNHPEGIKGAQTVALAIHLARKFRDEQQTETDLIKNVLNECVRFSGYNIDLRKEYVMNKFDETCQGTVPVALWIIGQSSSFEDAIRRAVSLGADADTLGAIVGSIAEAIWDIPTEMKEAAMNYLPDDMKDIVRRFYKIMSDMVHKRADIEKAKQMGYTHMRESGFEQVTLWFKQCFEDGILFMMDLPMLREGDFGGPYDLFVGINGKICMVDAWEDKIQE